MAGSGFTQVALPSPNPSLSGSSRKLAEVIGKAEPMLNAAAASGEPINMCKYSSAFMLRVIGAAGFGCVSLGRPAQRQQRQSQRKGAQQPPAAAAFAPCLAPAPALAARRKPAPLHTSPPLSSPLHPWAPSPATPPHTNHPHPPSLDIDSLNMDPDARTDSKLLMEASAMMVDGNLSTRWTSMVPPSLRPLVFPLMLAFPTPSLRKLKLGRDRMISLGIALSRGAMRRLGQEWADDIGMEACREWGGGSEGCCCGLPARGGWCGVRRVWADAVVSRLLWP
jgi:hypothetical protein